MKKYLLLFLLVGCVSEQEVRGKLYQMERIPEDICVKYPEIREYGIFRVISETEEEYIPYCSNRIQRHLSADRVHVEEWLRKATKPGRK